MNGTPTAQRITPQLASATSAESSKSSDDYWASRLSAFVELHDVPTEHAVADRHAGASVIGIQKFGTYISRSGLNCPPCAVRNLNPVIKT